jgi:hypothetical protein
MANSAELNKFPKQLTISVEGVVAKTKIQPKGKLKLLAKEKERPPRNHLKRLPLYMSIDQEFKRNLSAVCFVNFLLVVFLLCVRV